MCGRTACTLAPDELCKACSSKTFHVEWRDHPGSDGTYFTSYNVAPTSYTPVIFNSEHLRKMYKEETDCEYIMQPMMWNLIPHFYKGDNPKNCGFKTNNCRVETATQKQMFSTPLKKGQRCVVLCDGFYEWQAKDGGKVPHFIHAPQKENVKIWDRSSWDEVKQDTSTEKVKTESPSTEIKEKSFNEWNGPVPLKMAGLFNRWKAPDGEEIFSYCVLTTESTKGFSWLHHRVPVILEQENHVKMWLDEDVPLEDVLKSTSPSPDVKTYVVSKDVNNSRNNSVNCMKPAKETNEKKGCSFMSNWLQKKRPIAEVDNKEKGERSGKKSKSE